MKIFDLLQSFRHSEITKKLEVLIKSKWSFESVWKRFQLKLSVLELMQRSFVPTFLIVSVLSSIIHQLLYNTRKYRIKREYGHEVGWVY